MNKTKKLTQGAMMLSILGALILIDRLSAYLFSTFIVLIAPIIIIMYSLMQSFKDGLLLSVGILIISFILGNFELTYLIFIPVGIVVGLAYSYGAIKGVDRGTLALIAALTFVVGEVITSYVVYPILGFPVSQMIEEFKLSISETSKIGGIDYLSMFNQSGINFDKMIVVIFLIATVITGVLEGLLVHILALFLLKRFKIKDLGRVNVYEIKPNKIVAYACFLSMFGLFFRNKITNDTLLYILLTISLISAIILMYYGYIFITLYGAIVLRRNIGGIYVILCLFVPVLLIALIIMGFLYGAGPLRQYLENKVNSIKNG